MEPGYRDVKPHNAVNMVKAKPLVEECNHGYHGNCCSSTNMTNSCLLKKIQKIVHH